MFENHEFNLINHNHKELMNSVCCVFSSAGLYGMAQCLSVCPSICQLFHENIFSRTNEPILTKLGRKHQ